MNAEPCGTGTDTQTVPKTGKPAAFDKLMSSTSPGATTSKPLSEPKKQLSPPKSAPEMPRLQQLLSSPLTATPTPPPRKSAKLDTATMAENILTNQPELASFGEGKLSQLIETLFNDDSSAPAHAPKSTPLQPQRTPPVLQYRPPPTLTSQPKTQNPNPSLMRPPPSLQHMGTTISSPTKSSADAPTLPPTSLPTTSTTQLPQHDGAIESDEDFEDAPVLSDDETENVEKKQRRKQQRAKQLSIEEVFEQVENLFIKRGRARPDHNDQAHHWKSKWARGVAPEDVYIVQGRVRNRWLALFELANQNAFEYNIAHYRFVVDQFKKCELTISNPDTGRTRNQLSWPHSPRHKSTDEESTLPRGFFTFQPTHTFWSKNGPGSISQKLIFSMVALLA